MPRRGGWEGEPQSAARKGNTEKTNRVGAATGGDDCATDERNERAS